MARLADRWAKSGGFQGLLGNPLFQSGLGILGANAEGGNVVAGAMSGMDRAAQYRTKAEEEALREEQLKKQEEDRQRRMELEDFQFNQLQDQEAQKADTYASIQGILGQQPVDTRTASIMPQNPNQPGLLGQPPQEQPDEYDQAILAMAKSNPDQALAMIAQREQQEQQRAQKEQDMSRTLADKIAFEKAKAAMASSGGAGINDITPSHYTSKSIDKFRSSGNYKDLQRYEAIGVANIGGVETFYDKASGTALEPVRPLEQVTGNTQAISAAKATGTADAARIDVLKTGETGRKENLKEVNFLLDKVDRGELKTGKGQGIAASLLPNENQERLNALAEFAARSRLKASGETKPTDADVEGMKRTLFGVDKTKGFTVSSLERLKRELESQEAAFAATKGQTASGLPWEVID